MTLIMLVSLVPAAALGASAATYAVSESAITVLKQLESYSAACNGKFFGYGTACTAKDKSAAHTHNETEADKALRAELKDLDTAVNNFASKKGLSLTQGQHDALVLFCFDNGTAWLNGTGILQTAIVNKATGSDFLDAICRWDESEHDNNRRMIEANMYLKGVYNSVKPSSFITVTYDAANGSDIRTEYYDTASNPTADITPKRSGYTFLGWYNSKNARVTSLTADVDLTAKWQAKDAEPGDTSVTSKVKLTEKTPLYNTPTSKKSAWSVKGTVKIDSEYIDEKGNRWGRVAEAAKLYEDGELIGEDVDLTSSADWIKLSSGTTASGTTSSGSSVDVTVTVTNSYLRVRAEDSIYSTELRQVHQGDQLRIVKVSNGTDGFLWGKIEDNQGWIALMYTNYNTVKEQTVVNNSNAIATAIVSVNGYVNVRSDAGTNNQIVGSLANGTEVDLYETKFVNGIQWGRCTSGWFCLTYAKVTGLSNNNAHLGDTGFASYAFSGDLKDKTEVFTTAGGSKKIQLSEKEEKNFTGKNVVLSNLTEVNGEVWGKITEGWVKMFNADGSAANLTMDEAKFTVTASEIAVRQQPGTASTRIDTLVKGVEINVTQLAIKDESIWGYAKKSEGEYYGWVNLSTKYVTRGNAPIVEADKGTASGGQYTGTIATIVGADKVNVRASSAIYATQIGKISYGTQVPVLGEKNGWYKIEYDVDNNAETDSWVYKDYVKISEGTINMGGTSNGSTTGNAGSGSTAVETGLGIIANTYSGVNIRTAPGTGNAALGKILPGTTVEILEVTTYGAAKWGRVEKGWICMDYVTMLSNFLPEGSTGNAGTGNGSTTTSETAIYEGTIIGDVKVYKTTSLDAEVIRTLTDGATVTVHEILTVTQNETTTTENENDGETVTTVKTTKYWARVNDGYIYAPSEDNITLETLDEATYTIKEAVTVNDVKLAKNAKVTITTLRIKDGSVEGYAENTNGGIGWISMKKMVVGNVNVEEKVEENTNTNTNNNAGNTTAPSTPVIGAGSSVGGYTNTDGYRYTGKVINTNSLNVRATASTTAKKTTTLASGDSLVIYETTISENMAWGRCDAGWVYLYYVDLTPVVNGAVDARVVYNDNTIAYTEMNGGEVAGTYTRMSVIDIYEVVGKMARTELGWVHTDNLLN